MHTPRCTPWPLIAASCFVAGILVGGLFLRPVSADPPLPNTPKPNPFPMEQRLGANYWHMTSGEYRACTQTIYRLASDKLAATLKDRSVPRPAVIMDLDETVIDNSSFQTFLYREKLEYSDDLWARYEQEAPQDVVLVPGAKEFIDRAGQLGVTVVFISNRDERRREGTVKALTRLGLAEPPLDGRLFLKEKTSDKSPRRDAVSARFNVVQLYGDNLRDFAEAFAAPAFKPEDDTKVRQEALKARLDLVDKAAVHWGVDWFVLPNPVYGEWEKFLGPDPRQLLRPTSLPVVKATPTIPS